MGSCKHGVNLSHEPHRRPTFFFAPRASSVQGTKLALKRGYVICYDGEDVKMLVDDGTPARVPILISILRKG